ncbi:alpha/beta-hydrolase [Neofusicoccum parvum]|nr:alpha/beta-hydrolase [Neofusicoccum parvum]
MRTYFDTLRNAAFDDYENSLPSAFSAFFKKTGLTQKQVYHFVQRLKHLAKLVLLFAHVKQVDKCKEMPLVLHDDHAEFSAFMGDICQDANTYGWVRPEDIFHGIIELLGPTFNRHIDVGLADDDRGKKNLYLYSDFGWSVFFDTVQISLGKDPADVRPELINIVPGTPVNIKTNEWKGRIRDGIGFASNTLGGGDPRVQRGLTYVPRSIATTLTKKEYWAVRSQEFELSLYIYIEPTAEWKKCLRVSDFQEILGYRNMQDMLWHTFTTEDCEHAATMADEPEVDHKECKMGPDVAALIGFMEPPPYDDDECVAERILIYLTKGVPHLRWLAIREAVDGRKAYGEYGRNVILRGKYCCEDCALEQVALRPGKWALVL